MTTYLLKSPDGTISKWTMPELTFQSRLDKNGKYRHVSGIDGSVVLYEHVGIHKKRGAAPTTGVFFMRSYSMGIHPEQRVEAMKADAALGCSVEYDETGDAIFRSKGQFKKFAESHGFYAKNGKGGSYSDPQRLDAREREIRGLPQVAYEEPPEICIPGFEDV